MAADPVVDDPSVPRVRRGGARLVGMLGPAFVASIAYVDPGNVAANISAGARFGYLLVWVLVAANLIAVLVQFQSAKLGVVTGRSLPEVLAGRLGTTGRRLYWVQAEVVAAATDIAEVIGGAIALNLLFGLPLVIGGLIVGAVSMGLLLVQSRRGQRAFEAVIVALLAVIALGFLAALVVSRVDWLQAAGGLAPRFEGPGSVVLAASMLGATVMPHAIYLHSALSRDRHGAPSGDGGTARLVRATRVDVVAALAVAGVVNIAMLLAAAASLEGVAGTDSIAGAHRAIGDALGPVIAAIFAVGLLASGLASTSVGAYAGAVVMQGLLRVRVPIPARRAVTLIPALVLLAVGVDPTAALVLSQVVLSVGIPFALIPLVRLGRDRALMGRFTSGPALTVVSWVAVALVVALNATLIAVTVAG